MDKTIYSRQSQHLRQALVRLRQKAGLSQRELAEKLHREHSLVGRLELGERRLDLIEFFWICKACGVDPVKEANKLMREFEKIQLGQPE